MPPMVKSNLDPLAPKLICPLKAVPKEKEQGVKALARHSCAFPLQPRYLISEKLGSPDRTSRLSKRMIGQN